MDEHEQSREEIFKSYTEKEKILEEFEKKRKSIEDELGIKLSNIEATGLRIITKEVMKRAAQDNIERVNGNSSIMLSGEIPERFVFEFYGVKLSDLWRKRIGYITPDKPSSLDEATREWFRREQQKRHLI